MKLLLTSAGIKNPSIHEAMVGLLGKPIAESNALCIPPAGYGHPMGSPGGAWRVDDTVEVVSEGHWKLFTPGDQEA